MMLNLCIALALGGVADDQDTTKLAELCKKVEGADSYTFEVISESDGSSFGGRGRGGQGEQPEGPPPSVQGMYKKGSPVHLKRGETVAFREHDQLVVKTEEGWRPAPSFGRGGFGGGERGERPQRGEGGQRGERGEGGERGERPERGERGERPERGERGEGRGGRGGFDRGAMMLRGMQLPHESLKGFGDKVKDVTVEEVEGKKVFKGTLTEEGAQSMSMGGRMRRGGGGGGPEMDSEGTFEIVADPAHHTIHVTLKIKTSGSFGERSFERSTTTKIALREFGSTKFDVPAEALAQFEI